MVKAMIWKLLERFGVQGVQFVLQIILARLLSPENYGTLAIMIIFVNLATVFIQTGFSTALIQNKDVTEEDYSSVLWVTISIAVVLYGIIFFASPFIGDFYSKPELVAPLRVMALMLFPGALNSIQLAKVSRELNFKKVFYSNVAAIVFAGGVGVVVALLGGGLWALVAQTMLNTFIAAAVMTFTAKIRIRFTVNFARVKALFSFGWKILVSGLIDTLYLDISSLVIGAKYSPDTLGFYNRGKQFPQFIINGANGAVQSVMLPSLSEKQTERDTMKNIMRNAVTMSGYIIFPIMLGLASVATPMVKFLLTEKWLPCVPYLQIYCLSLVFTPVHSCNLQAINALGRSDVFLKLEIIKKVYGIIALVIAIVCFDSPIAIAVSGVVTTFISFFVNAFPNKKLINYSYFEQIKDIFPSFLVAILMCVCVTCVGFLGLGTVATLALQVVVGVTVYILLSALLRLKPFIQIISILKNFGGIR